MIAGLLHTVPALAPSFDALVADAVPGAHREHVVDAWMLETAIAEGVTPAVRERVASHLAHLVASGADAILVTCSSIGEAAEEAAASLRVPVVRVDSAMAAEAARLAASSLPASSTSAPSTNSSGLFRPETPSDGRKTQELSAGRIAVLATNTATLGPTTRLIEREAVAQGVDAVVTATVVEGAATARAAGDQATHDLLIAEAVRDATAPADGEQAAVVIVLAQASMAPAAESAGVAIPVLTSPAGGVARLVEALTPSDPGTPDASANRPAPPRVRRSFRRDGADRMTGVDLLVYADRLGGDLPRLRQLLDGPLRDFAGVHILPFFVPFDGADAGFDPIDHGTVDPRLGNWDDVRAIAAQREVTADLIVNHVSSESAEFVDWLALGEESAHDGMFLTFDTVFPDRASEDDITAFYRPRPGLPFTAYRMADGRRRLVWTTFLPSQIDLDVADDRARAYLRRILATLRAGGVTTVRLDAVGYAVKTPGSDSFMTPETLDFVREIVALAREEGLRVLVEVHAHYTQQLAIAPLVDEVYDFALAPLLLHSLGTGTSDRLAGWLRIRPRNAVTVLDTHDGIGIIDAGPSGDRPGLLDQDEMAAIFARAAEATHGHSTLASVLPAWMSLPHQINATFFSALGADARRYLLARAVQLWLPGRPQLYYVGLLGGLDDVALFERTGQGRDVNRHTYTPDEVEAALAGDVTRAQLALVRLRSTHPAFTGAFRYRVVADGSLELEWALGEERAALTVSFAPEPVFSIRTTGSGGALTADSVEALAAL